MQTGCKAIELLSQLIAYLHWGKARRSDPRNRNLHSARKIATHAPHFPGGVALAR